MWATCCCCCDLFNSGDAISNRSAARGCWSQIGRDEQVEDQAPAARLITHLVADFHVTTPLDCACRYTVLCADRVSGRAEQRPQHFYHPIMRLGCTRVSSARARVVSVKVHEFFLQPHLASGLWWLRGREESTWRHVGTRGPDGHNHSRVPLLKNSNP